MQDSIQIEARQARLQLAVLRALGHKPDQPPVFLTDVETAQILQQKPQTLAKWRCTGRYEIPVTKLGRQVLYRLTDVLDFIESRTQEVAID